MIYIDVDTAVQLFVNVVPLTDNTDFITRETAIAYDATGMDLVWNFQSPDGTITQTAVTPTTSGTHDWSHVGDALYSIEVPAAGGTINNDSKGTGWFTGVCDGVLPWVGPKYVFRPAAINDVLIDGTDSLQVDVTEWDGTEVVTPETAGQPMVTVKNIIDDAITAAAASADFGAEIAQLVEAYIVNEGDATAVMQAIADLIAADWVAGDASPLAIIAALKADAEWSNLASLATLVAAIATAVNTTGVQLANGSIGATTFQEEAIGAAALEDGALTVDKVTMTLIEAIRDEVTGYAGPISCNSLGQVRIADGTASGEIDTLSGAIVQVNQLGTQAKADINTEVVDALSIDTYSTPGNVTPSETASLTTMMAQLYKLAIAKIDQDSDSQDLYDFAGSTVDQTRTVSESSGTTTLGPLVAA